MRKYIVSIVGRPNVGKSTLFNRLCRKRTAIVDFEAGITRDRKYEDVEWNGKVFKLVDTGGIVFDSGETMDKMIKHQALLAIDESDLILFMVDAMTGTTDIDKEIARILFPHRDKVMLVANKADNEIRMGALRLHAAWFRRSISDFRLTGKKHRKLFR
jgi:GTP-binding protein